MIKALLKGTVFCFSVLMSCSWVSYADEASLATRLDTMQQQMMEMKNTMNWQKDKIRQLENQSPGVKVSQTGQQSDFGENYFENNLKSYIGDSHKWLKGLKFSGDFRLRYEILNERNRSTLNDRNRFRYRLRFGFEKKFSDEWKVGFRLVSAPGADVSPTRDSTNTTFDTQFAYKDIAIDKAYAVYTPQWALIGPVQEVEVTAGKFGNPLKDHTVPALWDGDVTPEGLTEQILIKGIRSDNLNLDLDLKAGQWVVEEGSGSENDDAEVYLFSLGLQSKIKNVLPKAVEMKNYITWYYWSDYSEPGNFGGDTGGNTSPGGNFTGPVTGRLSTAYEVLEFYNEVAFELFDTLPKMKIYFDYAQNVAENALDGFGAGNDKTWTLGAKLGKAKKKGSWEAKYEYVWIEANAVPGAFSDSDFGGPDERGSVIKLGYAITDNLILNTAMFFTNNIIENGSATRGDFPRELFQTDLVWKF